MNETPHTYLCIISLASNHDAEKNLPEARLCLEQILLDAKFSDAIWTEPIGSKRNDKYLNQLVKAFTTLSADELNTRLKAIEQHMGRSDADRRQGIVRVDLDLLQYEDQRFHLRDWERPYVKDLLPQL